MSQASPTSTATFDRWHLGDTRSCEVIVDAELVRAFATLSGDVNPVHVDAEFARDAGFPRPVAHGLLSLTAISRLIGTELPGPGALWMSQTVQFVRPVFVGETVIASVTVQHLSPATGVISLRTDVRNARTDEAVLAGMAQVRLLGQPTAGAVAEASVAAEAERARPAARESAATTRVALVTGSSRGIGRAIATALAAEGHAVVIHFVEREAEAAEVARSITEAGGRAAVCQADLRDADNADRLYASALAPFDRIDVLVNCASPAIVAKPALECDWADFERYLDVYLRTTMRLLQRVVPEMQARRFGRVINVVSSYAFGTPPPKFAPYVTAKSALAGLSRALAVELGPFGITVNMIAPSTVITEQTAAMSDRARQLAAAQIPMRRMAEAADVAAAAAFLASDGAAFLTGAVIPVTGGGVMW